MMLQTIPSFSFCNSRGVYKDEEDDGSYEEDDEQRVEFDEHEEDMEEREVRGGDAAMALESDRLGLDGMMKNMNIIKEVRVKEEICNVGLEHKNVLLTQKMYLAKGLGVSGGSGHGCGGGGGGYRDSGGCGGGGGDEGDKQGVEEYYKRMVEENPGSSLFLRNYAEFLHQVSPVDVLQHLHFPFFFFFLNQNCFVISCFSTDQGRSQGSRRVLLQSHSSRS